MRRFAGGLLAVALLTSVAIPEVRAVGIVIGTGSRAGIYYQAGRAICRLVNNRAASIGIGCQAPPTSGSIANLEDLRAGRLQIALAQSDAQFHAVEGTGSFQAAGPDPDLRSVFSLHGEPFTVVARRDAAIRSFDDLKGKRVNIGNPGSGQRATMETVMAAKGWDTSVFALANNLPADQQSLALCHDRVQAIVYTVGHPNASVGQAVGLCDAVIVAVKDPDIDRLVADNPFYAYTEVPGGVYVGNPDPVVTFGVVATLVSSARVDAETIYRVVESVFENFERFKAMHPAFAALDKHKMLRDGLSAPLHEGALRYYREKGLM